MRIADGKIDKIIPSTLTKVVTQGGSTYAVVTAAGKKVKLDLGSRFIDLKQSDNGNYYYFDDGLDPKKEPLHVRYHS